MRYTALFIALIQCCFASGAIGEARDNIKRVMIQADWIAYVVCVSNDTKYDTPHKDERFDETKRGTIAVAISDVFTNSGAFKEKNEDDFITFNGTEPRNYTASNWNALYLWNWLFAYKHKHAPDETIETITKYTTNLLKDRCKGIENIEAKIDKAEHDFKYYNNELHISCFLGKHTIKSINTLEYDIDIDDFYCSKFPNDESTSFYNFGVCYHDNDNNNFSEVCIKITDYISKKSTNKKSNEWVIYKTTLPSKSIDYIPCEVEAQDYTIFDVHPIDDKLSIFHDIIYGTGDPIFFKITKDKYDWERLYNKILSSDDEDYAYIYEKLQDNPTLNCDDIEQFRINIIELMRNMEAYRRQGAESDDNNVSNSDEEENNESINKSEEENEDDDSEGGD